MWPAYSSLLLIGRLEFELGRRKKIPDLKIKLLTTLLKSGMRLSVMDGSWRKSVLCHSLQVDLRMYRYWCHIGLDRILTLEM